MAKKWAPVVVTLAVLVAVVLGATVGREALLESGAATVESSAPVGESDEVVSGGAVEPDASE